MFPFAKQMDSPLITTLHGPKDLFWEPNFYKKDLSKANFCAISDFQKKAYFPITVQNRVYNGIPVEDFPFLEKKENFMFMLSLMWEEKGVHKAIKMSKETGIPLILAGKVRDDPTKMGGRGYFESQIKPHVDGKQIKFIGELNDKQKKEYFKKAKVYLHPCSVEESFGMVLAEAMACGTPVITFNKGAIPEVVKNKETGFVVNSLEEAIKALSEIDSISPEKCRKRVEDLFDSKRMAKNYLSLYKKIILNS